MVETKRMSLAEALNWASGLILSIRCVLLESEDIVDAWRMQRESLQAEKVRALAREPDPCVEPWAGSLATARDAAAALERAQETLTRSLDGIGKRIPPSIDPDGPGWETRAKMQIRGAIKDALVSVMLLPTQAGYSALTFPERCRSQAKILSARLDEIIKVKEVIAALPPAGQPIHAAIDKAYGAAQAFVENLAMLAGSARASQPDPDKPDAWQDVASNFAGAFIAWSDLTHLLTPMVRAEARKVYPAGASSIRLGGGTRTLPVVPAAPSSVENLLTPFLNVELDATPYLTVIEAVANGLGVYFRNAVYAGRSHPLEPDPERIANEAKGRAMARQVAKGKPAEPVGWGADLDELTKQETREVVRERLGIKTNGDVQDLMMREWNGQGRARGASALYLLRCDPINFADLRMQLIREAEAAIAAANKPDTPAIDPAMLARLEAGIAAVQSIGNNLEAGTGGTDTDWKMVQGQLLAKRERGEPYTSLRTLQTELGCSDATIRKAIDRSDALKGWQARSTGPKAAPKATDLDAVVRENTRQTTEPAPDHVLPDDDVDAAMARLIDQARPDERAKLNALDDAGRRALVAAYQAQNLDDEPSPLKPDKPGERPRKVTQHKRA